MKKFLLLTFVFILTFCCVSVASAEKYVVNTESDPLRIRLASDHSQILGQFRKGTVIDALYTDRYWAYFYYDGQLAVSYLEYLIPASSSSTTTTTTTSTSHTSSAPARVVSTNEASKIFRVRDSVNDCINARVSKSTSARSLGKLYPGDILYVVNVGYKWTRIVYNGQYAFVLTGCIEEVGPNLPAEGTLYQVQVATGTTLNVRETADRTADILRRIPNGAYVKVLESDEEWSKVYYDAENIGYVMNKFIILVE